MAPRKKTAVAKKAQRGGDAASDTFDTLIEAETDKADTKRAEVTECLSDVTKDDLDGHTMKSVKDEGRGPRVKGARMSAAQLDQIKAEFLNNGETIETLTYDKLQEIRSVVCRWLWPAEIAYLLDSDKSTKMLRQDIKLHAVKRDEVSADTLSHISGTWGVFFDGLTEKHHLFLINMGLKTGIIRVYGMRREDIADAIAEIKARIAQYNHWFDNYEHNPDRDFHKVEINKVLKAKTVSLGGVIAETETAE